MRSTRMLLATAAASAVLAITAPGAYAGGSSWEHEDSSYSKEHDKDSGHSKEYDKDGGHDSPRGGMHTGGGALTAVNQDGSGTAQDPKHDPETYKDKGYGKEHDKDGGYSKEHDKDGGHDSPRGGMHTGGGALTAVNEDDWGTAQDPKHDPETYKDGGYGKDSYGDDHEKPSGGMHTGGGALASPGVTAAGLAVLAIAGTGLYAVRRNRSARTVA